VAVTLARPLALLTAVIDESVAEAPLGGGANTTVTFGTGLPFTSFTTATSGAAKGAPTVALCGDPLDTVIVVGVLVSEKLAGVDTPVADAVTAYAPATVFAVAVTLARPVALVVAVIADSDTEAPLTGGANVTVTFGTGLL
jgi:hypothetical protein